MGSVWFSIDMTCQCVWKELPEKTGRLVKIPYINVLVIPRFSHSKTKNELSSYLAEKFLDHAMKTNLQVVGALRYQCRATQQNMNHLQSDQEEADTKMVLHALDATANGAVELYIHCPDTDVSCASKALSGAVCEDFVCLYYGW